MAGKAIIKAIAKRMSIHSFADKKVEPENVKPYPIVGLGYPAEDADLEAVDRFDAERVHYNKY